MNTAIGPNHLHRISVDHDLDSELAAGIGRIDDKPEKRSVAGAREGGPQVPPFRQRRQLDDPRSFAAKALFAQTRLCRDGPLPVVSSASIA
jgi:hypothetical protein